jgi:hypothetical protein
MFPDALWYELARLEGIHYPPNSSRSRPLRWGKYVMMFVLRCRGWGYRERVTQEKSGAALPAKSPSVAKEFGREKVHDQITTVVTIMKLCENMEDFRQKFMRLFNKSLPQMEFTFAR